MEECHHLNFKNKRNLDCQLSITLNNTFYNVLMQAGNFLFIYIIFPNKSLSVGECLLHQLKGSILCNYASQHSFNAFNLIPGHCHLQI